MATNKHGVAGLERRTRPRQWVIFRRPLAERLGALGELIARAPDSPEAHESLMRIWQAELGQEGDELLTAIGEAVPIFDPTDWIPKLIDALGRTPQANTGRTARNAFIQALTSMAQDVLQPLAERLVQPGDEGARWALHVLREIGLRSAGSAFCTVYAQPTPSSARCWSGDWLPYMTNRGKSRSGCLRPC